MIVSTTDMDYLMQPGLLCPEAALVVGREILAGERYKSCLEAIEARIPNAACIA